MSDFFTVYNRLKAELPGLLEEHYYRAVQEELGYSCLHPFLLLRMGQAGGAYLKSEIDRAHPVDRMKVVKRWMKNQEYRDILWCPVCRTYPYRKETADVK